MPKVIDFGIAKATGQSLTDKTLFTGFAQLIGTPLVHEPGAGRCYLERAETVTRDVVAAVTSTDDRVALNGVAWFLATRPDPRPGDPMRAVELATKAVAKAPQVGGIWNTLGVARYRAGAWDAAIEALSRSVELTSGGSEADWLSWPWATGSEARRTRRSRWYDKAIATMDGSRSGDEELIRFREEETTLMRRVQPGDRMPNGPGAVRPVLDRV